MDLHGKMMNLRCVVPVDIEMASDRAHAYKLGQRDGRHAAAELALKADACIDALRALMNGNEFKTLQGEAAWHKKSMPSNADLDRAREALTAFDGRVLVSG